MNKNSLQLTMAMTVMLPIGRTTHSRYRSLQAKIPPHKQHIWFLPMLKPNPEKTKRAVFFLRSKKHNLNTDHKKKLSIFDTYCQVINFKWKQSDKY